MKKALLVLTALMIAGILACNGAPQSDEPTSLPEQTMESPKAEPTVEVQQPANTPLPPTATPTAVPIATAQPTATLEPSPVPEPVKLEFNGRGNSATDMFYLKAGLIRFECNHQGQRNFIVWLLDDTGDEAELVANKIGNYQGSGAFNVRDAGQYLLAVDADGAWSVVFTQP